MLDGRGGGVIPPGSVGSSVNIASFGGVAVSLGQKPMATSIPVTLASDQGPIAVTFAGGSDPVDQGAGTGTAAGFWTVRLSNGVAFVDDIATETTLATRASEATLAAVGALLNTRLDVNLSTRASEATLATRASEATLANVLTTAAFQARVDVALSTRASEATLATRASEATLATRASEATLANVLTTAAFQARINTLGQKTMANSTPVVLASDQAAIPVTPSQPAQPTPGINLGTDPDVSWKASAGTIFSVYCVNKNTTKRYLQVFNKASAPTNGDTPVWEWPVAPEGTANIYDSMTLIGSDFFTAQGSALSTGIATGFSTTSGTYTAGSAADQVIGIEYA